jgi:hypothetical protein
MSAFTERATADADRTRNREGEQSFARSANSE